MIKLAFVHGMANCVYHAIGAHTVISVTDSYLFLMEYPLRAQRSRVCNIDFWPMLTDISPGSPNILIILCP